MTPSAADNPPVNESAETISHPSLGTEGTPSVPGDSLSGGHEPAADTDSGAGDDTGEELRRATASGGAAQDEREVPRLDE